MIDKIPTGIACLDTHLGGAFQGRPLLVTGRRNSGKTIFGLQFVRQGLELGERGLMLSMRPTQDLAIYARSMGLNVDAVVEAGDLFLLEYSDVIPGRDKEENITLPPEGFAQLMDIIGSEYIRRVVIDTVIPWIIMVSRDHLPEHIFSFVRAFERLGVTTLFTCSQPVSPAAQHAHRMLETNVPVSITLSYNANAGNRSLLINKYIGSMDNACRSMPYRIEQNLGIVCVEAVSPTSNLSPFLAPTQVIPHHVLDAALRSSPEAPIPMAPVPGAPGTRPSLEPPPTERNDFQKTASFSASLFRDAVETPRPPASMPVPPPPPAVENKPNFADAMFRTKSKDA